MVQSLAVATIIGRVKYGLEVANGGDLANPKVLAGLARDAEVAGWDGIFVEDYVVWQGHLSVATYDPWILLAVIAANTSRIRLGTTVTPLPRRRPWNVAKEAVTLDHLSGGRLILGVGLGDLADQGFGAVGEEASLATRGQALDEALEIIIGAWSGVEFTHHGVHFRVDGLQCLPTPIQQPRIPIWVGGNWPLPGVMRRASHFDGFVGGKVHGEAEGWRLTANEVRSLRADLQRNPSPTKQFDIALGGALPGGDVDADRRYVAEIEAAGATWWMEYVNDAFGNLDAVRTLVRSGPLSRR